MCEPCATYSGPRILKRLCFAVVSEMMLVAFLFIALTAAAALAAPPSSYATRTAAPLSEGIHEGFFYTWWTDNPDSQASYTNGGKGNFGRVAFVAYPIARAKITFSITWTNEESVFGGKGWQEGSSSRYTLTPPGLDSTEGFSG